MNLCLQLCSTTCSLTNTDFLKPVSHCSTKTDFCIRQRFLDRTSRPHLSSSSSWRKDEHTGPLRSRHHLVKGSSFLSFRFILSSRICEASFLLVVFVFGLSNYLINFWKFPGNSSWAWCNGNWEERASRQSSKKRLSNRSFLETTTANNRNQFLASTWCNQVQFCIVII